MATNKRKRRKTPLSKVEVPSKKGGKTQVIRNSRITESKKKPRKPITQPTRPAKKLTLPKPLKKRIKRTTEQQSILRALQEQLRIANEQIRQQEEIIRINKKLTEDTAFDAAMEDLDLVRDPRLVKEDGSDAMRMSRLRMLDEDTRNSIKRRLADHLYGSYEYRLVAKQISSEYGVYTREVYTLIMSP